MTARYEVTFETSIDLLQRAMTQGATPPNTRRSKWLFLAGCVCVGALNGVVLTVTGVFAMVHEHFWMGLLIGFYVGLVLWYFVHRSGVKKLAKMSAAQIDRQGPTRAVFTSDKITFETAIASSTATWVAYDQVTALPDATVLRSGGVVYPIPHDALPADVDSAGFHADLARWQEAAQ